MRQVRRGNRRFSSAPIESLESRVLMTAAAHHDHETFDGAELHVLQTAYNAKQAKANTSAAQAAGASIAAAQPAFSSLPGALDTLFLDFDGHFDASWGGYSNVTTPEFNLDGAAGFNAAELTAIENIWKQVAEDYSPYNINVTTVEPASFANGVSLRVAIGGDGSWFGSAGGVAYIDTYTNSIVNTVYVFPQMLSNDAKYIAEASSHEAGHGYGLNHQSQWVNGTKTEYYAGPGDGRAPIMGNSYYATRGVWWNGTTTSATTFQDDMSILAKAANTFGYRVDDFGNTASTAFTLTPIANNVNASGIIHQTSDKDFFAFTTGAGNVAFSVTVPSFNNLDSKLELWSSDGVTLLASASPTNSFGASFSLSVGAGSYRVAVLSNGLYGDVGQYTLSGTIVAASLDAVAAPSGLVATTTGTSASITWADNANNETAYVLQRSTDAAFAGATSFNLGANAVGYSDSGLAIDTTYYYRVYAQNATETSPFSNTASAPTVPAQVASVTATALSSSQISLSWSNVGTETGFRIERSGDGQNFTTLTTLGANATSLTDGLLAANFRYYYRVTALNSAGEAPVSPVASALTLPAANVPAAPSNLRATAVAATRITLAWNDNASNETGFTIQRSTNGGSSWTTVGTVGPNVTTFTNVVSKRKTYVYRVYATGSGGNSDYSNNLTVTTPNRGSVVFIPSVAGALEQLKKSLLA